MQLVLGREIVESTKTERLSAHDTTKYSSPSQARYIEANSQTTSNHSDWQTLAFSLTESDCMSVSLREMLYLLLRVRCLEADSLPAVDSLRGIETNAVHSLRAAFHDWLHGWDRCTHCRDNEKSAQRCKHSALAVVRRSQKFLPLHRPLPGGARIDTKAVWYGILEFNVPLNTV